MNNDITKTDSDMTVVYAKTVQAVDIDLLAENNQLRQDKADLRTEIINLKSEMAAMKKDLVQGIIRHVNDMERKYE